MTLNDLERRMTVILRYLIQRIQ